MERLIKLINDRPSVSMKRYVIYKKDINHYRILDSHTGEFVEGDFRYLTIKNPSFRVDIERYNEAEKANFVNDGNPKSFFAWIESDEVFGGVLFEAPHQIKFNPFNGNVFYRTDNNTAIYSAKLCTVLGNNLYVL